MFLPGPVIRLLGTERNGRQGEGSLREEVEKKEEEETGEQTKEGERKKEKCKEEGDVESRRPGAQNGGGKWNGDRRRCRYHLWRQEEGKEAEARGAGVSRPVALSLGSRTPLRRGEAPRPPWEGPGSRKPW